MLGQPKTIFEISASDACLKVERSGSDVGGEDEGGVTVADEEVRDKQSH